MTIAIIIGAIVLFVQAIFIFVLPAVHLNSLPFVGSAVYDALVYMVTIWNSFMVTFPYALTAWHIFLYLILPFELIMLIAKFFLGHRLPSNHIN